MKRWWRNIRSQNGQNQRALLKRERKRLKWGVNPCFYLVSHFHCRNTNVIAYKEAFFDDESESLCLVMEYAERGDLEKRIRSKWKKEKHFSENEVWYFLLQLLNGLKALHSANILHRDLKSANVFLTRLGEVKLGDLNVSKIINQDSFKHT